MPGLILKKAYIWRVITLMLIVSTFSNLSFSQSKIDSDRISGYVKSIKESYNLPGVTVSVTDLESTIYLEHFGKIKPEEQILIGSCSKSFTALLILKLQEKNLLSIDDPVVEYLPWFRYANKSVSDQITIKNLLHQTSGIPHRLGRILVEEDAQGSTKKEIEGMLSGLQIEDHSSQFEYSNINYRLLGFIIEKVTDKEFGEALDEKVLKPVKLMNTSGKVLRENDSGFPMSYNYFLYYPVLPYLSQYTKDEIPSGYISSTASEMAIYLRDITRSYIQNSGVLIDQNTAMSLFQKDSMKGSNYALGWFVDNWQNTDVFYHTGLTEGFNTCMIILPEEKKAIFVGINSGVGQAFEIAAGIFHILIDKDPRVFSKTTFYLIRSIPLLVLVLVLIMIIQLMKWRKSGFPMRLSKKLKPNVLLILGITFGAIWLVIFPILYVTSLKVIIRYDPVSGISLILIAISIILISLIRYFKHVQPENQQ